MELILLSRVKLFVTSIALLEIYSLKKDPTLSIFQNLCEL